MQSTNGNRWRSTITATTGLSAGLRSIRNIGSILVTIVNGTTPFAYQWAGPTVNNNFGPTNYEPYTIQNLVPNGAVHLTVTDGTTIVWHLQR